MAETNDYPRSRALLAVKLASFALFMLCLCMPVIQNKFGVFKYTAVQENRRKAARPHDIWTLFKSGGGDFAGRFETFFNDSYGLRDFLIRLHNQINYSVFGQSSKVLIGNEGWLFYKDVYEDGVVQLQSAAAGLPKLFDRMVRLNDYLKARGVVLVVVPCPMKTTIYPEKIPPTSVRAPRVSAFQKYRAFLRSHPEILSIDVQGRLENLKQSMPVYHKTDFHWNDPAGAYVMKDMIDLLGRVSGTGVTWDIPIKIRIDKGVGGGEINSLGVFWPPYEDMLMIAENPSIGIGTFVDGGRSNQWTYRSNEKSPAKLLPSTVMFGDSFADAFLRTGITLPFSGLSKFYNLEFKEKFKEIPTGSRFFVLEHIESNLVSMLSDSYWPSELQ